MRILLMLVFGVLGVGQCLAADVYPSKPVHFIVFFGPGVPDDLIARALSQQLAAQTGKTFIVENRTGASGAIGATYVAKSAPDGYTIGVVSTAWPATPLLNKAMPYNASRDFTPIMQTTRAPMVLVVSPALKTDTLKDFIALAQANPGKLNFGSAGPGSAIHLSEELFSLQAKVKLGHVPYRGGSSEIMSAVIGGEVQMFMTQVPPVLAQIKAGRLRGLAVTTEANKRLSSLPEVPSMSEAGVPGLVIYNWGGLVGPAGLPTEIVNRLHAEFAKALAAPAVKDPIIAQGTELVGSNPEEFAAYIRSEVQRWTEVIKSAGITIE